MPVESQLAADDTAGLSPSGPYRALKQAGLVVLFAAWVLLGLFGRDPWKPDDAVTFGISYDMVSSGDFVVPQIAGVPAPDRPPLFPALAAACAWSLKWLLPLHDGARVASALCLGLVIWLVSLTGRELYGRAFRWLPILVLIGCIGLWDRAHMMSPELGMLTCGALALYALALAPRRPTLAGVLLGLAIGLGFLTRGTLAALMTVALALPLAAFAPWRSRRYALTLVIAAVVAAPIMAAWPLALRARDPAMLAAWALGQSPARALGISTEGQGADWTWYAKNLLWYAWPALPLAVWTLWIRRGALASAGVALPLTMIVVWLLALSVAAAEPRALLTMPILLPLSLLAAAEVDSLRRGASSFLDWFGILTFGLLGVLVWGLWLESLRNGLPEAVARQFRDTDPGFSPPIQLAALGVALFLSLLWIVLVRPARRSNRRAVLNWAAGMTLLWGLYMTIWLPYLDSRRSYRPVAESLAARLPPDACVASHNLGEPQRALLEYFSGLRTHRDEVQPDHGCPWLLLQVGRDDSPLPPDSGWSAVWEGHRRGDDTERYLLFMRNPAPVTP
jgi:4-amino-4-deoxy-L-arabinose transferase-like glycosyltransferase